MSEASLSQQASTPSNVREAVVAEQKRVVDPIDLSQENMSQSRHSERAKLKILPHQEKFETTMRHIEQLADGKELADRISAARALKDLECPEATIALCSLGLSDPELEGRRAIINILRDSPSRQILDWLCKVNLTDANSGQSFAAALVLAGTKDPPTLRWRSQEGLSHPEPRMREAAIWALFQTKDREAIEALIQKGLEDPDDYVCHRAALALMECGDEQAHQALARVLLGSRVPWVREGAAWGLKHVRSLVAENALIQVLCNKQEDDMLQIVAAVALEGTNNPEAISVLSGLALNGPAVHVRHYAILGLKGTTNIDALKIVHLILVDPQEEPRLKAAAAEVLAARCQQTKTTGFDMLKSNYPNLS
jgi:HEAT repeat protein